LVDWILNLALPQWTILQETVSNDENNGLLNHSLANELDGLVGFS
jgi:hypothetical protein